MTPNDFIKQAEQQKWFEYLSTLQPYLKGNKENPTIELCLILQRFINEAEQSINSIVNEAVKQEKRAKLSELYKAHDLGIQACGIMALQKIKNQRQQVRLNEVETLLIELADENRILKAQLDWKPE